MFHRSLPEPARDVLVLAARLTVAFVMLAHVWDTFGVKGFTTTSGQFENLGIPLAIAATAFTLVVELVGSILLAVGLFVPYASGLMTFVMLGAVFFVHAEHGVFVKNNGWELVGLIAAVCVAIAANGAGRISLDHLIFDRRKAPAAPAPVDVSSDPAGVPIAPAPVSFRQAEPTARAPRWDNNEPRWNPEPRWADRPAPAPRWAQDQAPVSLWDDGAPTPEQAPTRVPSAYATAGAGRPDPAQYESVQFAAEKTPVWTEPAPRAEEQARSEFADSHTQAITTVGRTDDR